MSQAADESLLPPEDAGTLRRFPSLSLGTEQLLWRVHRSDLHPAHFSQKGEFRFDPPVHSRSEFGTCYTALDPLCAFMETLSRFNPIPQRIVDERALSGLLPARRMRVADLTDPSVIGDFGIKGDLSTGGDYRAPQAWAAALRTAGFDGLQYIARHDPSANMRSIAIFGPPGEQPDMFQQLKDTGPIPVEVLLRARDVFHVIVLPAAPLP